MDTLLDILKERGVANVVLYYSRLMTYIPIIQKYIDNKNTTDWDLLCKDEKGLSINFLTDLRDKLNWDLLTIHQDFNDEIILKFEKRLNWDLISEHQQLSVFLCDKYKDKINWVKLSNSNCFDKEFIRQFKDYIDWSMISNYRSMLSPSFLKEFEDKITEPRSFLVNTNKCFTKH